MSQIAKIGAFATGGLGLFAISFVMFAALSGVPMKDIAVLNRFASEPPDKSERPLPAEPDREEIAPPEEVIQENSKITDAFVLDSPFTSEELTSLQHELKTRLGQLEQKRQEQIQHEDHLDTREKNLESRYAELMRLRTMLEEYEIELGARSQEIERDAEAQKERENLGWTKLAKTFQDGEIETLIERLISYEPEDAAKILRALDDERAGELIRLLSPEDYRSYADAYRELEN